MIVSDIQTRVKRQFGDESGVQITDADIIRWINDAQRDIAMKHNLLQTSGIANVVAGQADYSPPADLLSLHSVRYKGQRLIDLSMQETDLDHWADEPVDNGVPTRYTYYSGTITLYPTPTNAVTGGLRIIYTKQPTDVVLNADTIGLPAAYNNAIVNYCLTAAYELDENWQAAQFKSAEFNGDMGELKGKLEAQPEEFYPHITYVGAADSDWYW